MNLLLTIDYELFLQEPCEDIFCSLIQPTYRFHELLKKYRCRAVYFVDVGYLYALYRQQNQHSKLRHDFTAIIRQLKFLENEGNEIGLHIHPHWEDSYFDGNKWIIDLKRYKLADFNKSDAQQIFVKYYQFLQYYISHKIISFRAGGWCLPPFDYIRQPMLDCGIIIDSSVYYGGYANNDTHYYDFRKYPVNDIWRFNEDPSIEDPNGLFCEIPFSTYLISPLVYWNVMRNRFFSVFSNKRNGISVNPALLDVTNKLLKKTIHPVSMDSLKSNTLLNNFIDTKISGKNIFSVIGHSKSLDETSFRNIELLIGHATRTGHFTRLFSELI